MKASALSSKKKPKKLKKSQIKLKNAHTSARERSEPKCIEASFPGGSVFCWWVLHQSLTRQLKPLKPENRNHRSISECFHCAPTKGSYVIIQVNLVRPNHLSGQNFDHD